MNNRLQQFLTAENISQSVFADTIGVARASVSHILAGRNKPGFDFIESMSRHYPMINLEWLITGKGKMYKSDTNAALAAANPAPAASQGTFASPEQPALQEPVQAVSMPAAPQPQIIPEPKIEEPQHEFKAEDIKSIALAKSLQQPKNQRSISRIIVLYNDGSYQELK